MISVDQIIRIIQMQMAVEVVVGISMLGTSQETVIAMIDHLAIGVKLMVALVEIKGIELEVEVGLTPAQMSEDQE